MFNHEPKACVDSHLGHLPLRFCQGKEKLSLIVTNYPRILTLGMPGLLRFGEWRLSVSV
jgi:hypothetical protein